MKQTPNFDLGLLTRAIERATEGQTLTPNPEPGYHEEKGKACFRAITYRTEVG
jgi:hypothetical protein